MDDVLSWYGLEPVAVRISCLKKPQKERLCISLFYLRPAVCDSIKVDTHINLLFCLVFVLNKIRENTTSKKISTDAVWRETI
jgi:hypothetical protein